MIRFALSLVIRRPVADVFALYADPARLTSWQSGVVSVDAEKGPVRKGARCTIVRKALGRTQEMRRTIVGFEENVRIVETERGGPAKSTTTTLFSATPDGGTHLDTTVEVDLGGVLGLLGDKLAAGTIEKQARGDQARLKALLEGG